MFNDLSVQKSIITGYELKNREESADLEWVSEQQQFFYKDSLVSVGDMVLRCPSGIVKPVAGSAAAYLHHCASLFIHGAPAGFSLLELEASSGALCLQSAKNGFQAYAQFSNPTAREMFSVNATVNQLDNAKIAEGSILTLAETLKVDMVVLDVCSVYLRACLSADRVGDDIELPELEDFFEFAPKMLKEDGSIALLLSNRLPERIVQDVLANGQWSILSMSTFNHGQGLTYYLIQRKG